MISKRLSKKSKRLLIQFQMYLWFQVYLGSDSKEAALFLWIKIESLKKKVERALFSQNPDTFLI